MAMANRTRMALAVASGLMLAGVCARRGAGHRARRGRPVLRRLSRRRRPEGGPGPGGRRVRAGRRATRRSGRRSSAGCAARQMPPAGKKRPDEADLRRRRVATRDGARPGRGRAAEPRPHRHAPAADPHRVPERRSATCWRWTSTRRRCCRRTRPATGSTTSPWATSRRRCWTATSPRRRRSAGWRSAARGRRPAATRSASGRTSPRKTASRGCPLGTRGGTLIRYTFPQDGEYDVQVRLARDRNEHVEGLHEPHELEVLLDRERVESFTVKPPAGGQGPRERRRAPEGSASR